jgi:hypothetical protein
MTVGVIMKNGQVQASEKATTVKVMFEVLLGENEENHKGQPGAQSRLNLHTS